MASSDWLDLRGWFDSAIGWTMDQTHDLLPDSDYSLGPLGSVNPQSGFSSIQPALESFFHATIMCTVVFTTLMLTMLAIPYIERKFIGRLMDRLGATTTLRSLWVGESGVTAGEWWNQLPFGIGTPIGWVVKALNANWGNDHELETVSRVNNRSYHGYWFLLPGFFQAFADFFSSKIQFKVSNTSHNWDFF